MMMAERRSSRELSRESSGSKSLQKRLAEIKLQQQQQQQQQHVPDLTDFMNDMFFGTAKVVDKKSYDLTGSGGGDEDDDDDDNDFESSTRSSRQTQEWLEQARRIVAASPTRCDSPTRLSVSPRFAAAAQGRLSLSSQLDRRDPLSRSARRHRTLEGYSGEILTKSAKHSRNRSEILDGSVPGSPTSEESPSSPAIQKWEDDSNLVLNQPPSPSNSEPTDPTTPPALLPPRKSTSHRRSRFQTDTTVVVGTPPHTIVPSPQRRTFKSTTAPHDMLSLPKNLVGMSSHRRTMSSGTCSVSNDDREVLSPPRSLMESANRRSISSSTCSIQKIAPANFSGSEWINDGDEGKEMQLNLLNGFLKEQKLKIRKVLNGDDDTRAKIVLSAPSNSTSSMVAAICYAWLLEKRTSKNTTKFDEGKHHISVPVMNCKRPRMWKQKQAAWLFHHVGIDVRSLLFADEVDLESLMMAGKLNIFVVGQDVLKTNSEVGSSCTILTDNFCEEAYDLLQIASLKKLLLAGILLDTKNLNAPAKLATTRDAEAVQLLLVGSAPNYRNTLFDQLMQDARDSGFTELLRQNYGKPPSENSVDGGAMVDHGVPERKSTSIQATAKSPNNAKPNDLKTAKSNKSSPKSTDNKQKAAPAQSPAKGTPNSNRGKNTFFLAKWLGFGR